MQTFSLSNNKSSFDQKYTEYPLTVNNLGNLNPSIFSIFV